MKIEKLSKKKNGMYEIEFEDSTTIILNEDTIIKYHLLVGKEVELTSEILKQDERQTFYNKALSYAIKYNKSSKEVINYLTDKDVSYFIARNIVNELIEKKLINDQFIATNIAGSLARNSNGPLMIKEKLKRRLFSEDIITCAINSVSDEDYENGLSKLKDKLDKKFSKEDIKTKEFKIKKQLYAHGYVSGD